MLLAAELDSAGTAADRVACYQRTLGRLQPVKEGFEARFKAGLDRATYNSILVFQLDTEIAYERVKLEAEKK